MSLKNITIEKFHDGLRRKEFSLSEAIAAFFSRIKEKDGEIHAFLEVYEEKAKKEARRLEQEEISSPLFGVPMAIKDNILISGHRTTAGSRILENYIAPYDATVIAKLKESKTIFVGKTNLDEFAMGSSTENSAFFATANPHDTSRVAGGSSGGSAAAVASEMALGALGSDTGGSIRQPAAFCGVTGLKPTYGAVSRMGAVALSSSLDQIGPFASTVRDTALIFRTIAGNTSFDATTEKVDYSQIGRWNESDVKKLRLGVPKEYFGEGISDEVKRGVEKAVSRFEKDGFAVRGVSLPHTSHALSCYYIVLPAEASANLARYDGIRYASVEGVNKKSLLSYYLSSRGRGFGDEPKRRILLGAFVLSSGYYDAYYGKAQKVRRLILDDFLNVFEKKEGVDALLTPVTPTTAFHIGEKSSDPLNMYLSDIFTIPVNLAGLPALSLPVSSQKKGELPIGFQIIGRHFEEQNILALGDYYETRLRE